MTLKNNREHLPCPYKLCVSIRSHPIIWTGVTTRKRSYWSQSISFSPCLILKFERWHWKTIGHLFYPTSNFVHHFVAIDEFKLELQSWNAQFGSKSATFSPMRPWNLTDDLEKNGAHLLTYFKLCSSFRSHWWIQTGVAVGKRPIKSGQNRWFFVPCDLEIWRMALKNIRVPLLCYFKLYASFLSHLWIQVRKNSNLGKICFDLCDLDLWPLTLTFRMDITYVDGNNSWKFHDDTMGETL